MHKLTQALPEVCYRCACFQVPRTIVQQPFRQQTVVAILFIIGSIGPGLIGCGSDSESGVYRYAPLGEGSEPPPDLTPFDTLHLLRDGAQMTLSYDLLANAFTGTVENTTAAALRSVAVEVHLSNGTTLGPTVPIDLAPRQVVDISIAAGVRPFTLWSASLEVG